MSDAAKTLLGTLAENGVTTCFANPGTSEMHLVAGLDGTPSIRPVLCLFEGICSSAADGYGRISGLPAATLLHLGPGLSNASANLHNAQRAGTPILNLVGDHATAHRRSNAPLTSDVEGLARPISKWVRTSALAGTLARDAAEAIGVARSPRAGVASLIIPADLAWRDEVPELLPKASLAAPLPVEPARVDEAARALRSQDVAILLDGDGLLSPAVEHAGRIAAATGARLLCPTFPARLRRGRGTVAVERLPYFPEQASSFLRQFSCIIMAGADPPKAFFAYRNIERDAAPPSLRQLLLSEIDGDTAGSLAMLADVLGAGRSPLLVEEPILVGPDVTAPLSAATLAHAIAALLPVDVIVSDECATLTFSLHPATRSAASGDWLYLTGGSIGQGLGVALGAAIAAPHRKVVCISGDGGAAYTPQALWSMARENADVTVVIVANRQYRILGVEMQRNVPGYTGSGSGLFDLDRPVLDWVQLASGFGVDARRAETVHEFSEAFRRGLAEPGPFLIEAIIP